MNSIRVYRIWYRYYGMIIENKMFSYNLISWIKLLIDNWIQFDKLMSDSIDNEDNC